MAIDTNVTAPVNVTEYVLLSHYFEPCAVFKLDCTSGRTSYGSPIIRQKENAKKKNENKGKGKAEYLAPKVVIVKQKFEGTCYNCDQPGHRAANCKMPKRVNPRHDNMVNDNMDMIAMVSDVIDMISDVNLSDKFVLSKNQMYVGKGYALNDEAIDKFVLYKTEVENQLGRKIKIVRSDRRGEYVSPFVELCAKHGIRHEFTAPYLPQQNGIAERKNRTLKEMETGSSSRLDDEVVQYKRQRDDNDLHDERQDQLEEEEVEPRRSKRARTEKSFRPDFVSFMVENEPTSYEKR
nr:retrotransposon protein, putative, Ty1-copia subclass [Tanacetum cinerariifolium]